MEVRTMAKNLIQLWEENNEIVPFKARRDNWNRNFYVVVEKVEVGNYPYGKVYGYPVENGVRNNHFAYNRIWREEGIIPNAGSYQWNLVKDDECMNAIEGKTSEVGCKHIESQLKSCPKCGSKLIIRTGIRGKFIGCSNFPNCRYTENII